MPALPTQPRSSRIRDARHERVRVQKLQTIYLQNRGIDHIRYSISLGLGIARKPQSSIDLASLSKEYLSKQALIAKIQP